MEKTQLDNLWIFGLSSSSSSQAPLLLFLLFLSTSFIAKTLIYWAHPGGPAWGRYRRERPKRAETTGSPIIPGPKGLPLIGSMAIMTGLAHRKLAAAAAALRATHLMALSLGDTRVVVTSHPDVAKDILSSSDFADRPAKASAQALMFDRAIGFAPYGVYWRTLRRIAAAHLFSPKQIGSGEARRLEIAAETVAAFRRLAAGEFRVRDVLKRAALNHMMGSVFGRRYGVEEKSAEVEELSGLVQEGYHLLGQLNWSDHLQWLAWFDLQKIGFRCSELAPRVKRFVGRIIAEHAAGDAGKSADDKDFVDVLLSLDGQEKLSNEDMVAVLWEMIFRGTDVVAVLMEWVLARMVLHPDIQAAVRKELENVVGTSRPVKESDIPSMVYLPAVIKEVLRLHPPGPLLSWSRLAITDSTVDGFHVPAGTTAMVNIWAIMRDPKVWVDPLKFTPGRFVTRDGDVDQFSVFGSDLRLAPFGSGRRICPGKNLGLTTVTFWVATLLHEFEWSAPDQSPVDLSEVLKLSSEMANPLVVKVRPKRG